MQINSIQNLSFKATQLKKDNNSASQAAQIKKVMEKKDIIHCP